MLHWSFPPCGIPISQVYQLLSHSIRQINICLSPLIFLIFWAKTDLRTELSLISLMDDVIPMPKTSFRKVYIWLNSQYYPYWNISISSCAAKWRLYAERTKKTHLLKYEKWGKKSEFLCLSCSFLDWLIFVVKKAVHRGLARAICWSHRHPTFSAALCKWTSGLAEHE